MAKKWNTIHIFGYGETQIIGQETIDLGNDETEKKPFSIKVATNSLTKVQPLIDEIYSKKPQDNTTPINEYHAITLFSDINIRWGAKNNGKSWAIELASIDNQKITDLFDEMNALP